MVKPWFPKRRMGFWDPHMIPSSPCGEKTNAVPKAGHLLKW